LVLTYGNSASTGSYSATGGTNSYTWSLGSVITGITLSGTVVTASNTLAAGTYTQNVVATVDIWFDFSPNSDRKSN
jgi:hypothetical protein